MESANNKTLCRGITGAFASIAMGALIASPVYAIGLHREGTDPSVDRHNQRLTDNEQSLKNIGGIWGGGAVLFGFVLPVGLMIKIGIPFTDPAEAVTMRGWQPTDNRFLG